MMLRSAINRIARTDEARLAFVSMLISLSIGLEAPTFRINSLRPFTVEF